MQLKQTLTGNITRSFVKYPHGETEGTIEIHRPEKVADPLLSIVIPTIDKRREGYLPALLSQLDQQTFRNFEVLLVIKDTRQGRAINSGVALASGKYIVIFDDDTRLGTTDILEKMVESMELNPEIGMAGVANLVPADASWFVRQVMRELPRRTSPIVHEITDSDLAEHPCCIIPRDVFIKIGGENEIIPRGLDPYLRQEIRQAGYRVVVLPELFIHHLPPATFKKFIRQFYRNGKMAAYVNKFYPEFVVELAYQHGDEVKQKRSLIIRIISYNCRVMKTVLTLRLFYLLSLILYLTGFVIGYLTLNKSDV
jgi:glycosyltransferase involved in cell wall biosynthesis